MKKLLYLFATLIVCFAVSCTKETPDTSYNPDEAPVLMKVVTLSASVDDAETKTFYTYEGNVAKFSWTAGDRISVVCTDGRFYTFTAQETGKSVSFMGEIPMDEDLGSYAYFPADPNHEVDKFHLPAVKYSGKSFSADLPMAATIINRTCTFQHMTGAAHLRFTGFANGVDSAKISIVNPSLKISGLYPVKTQDGVMLYEISGIRNESEGQFIRTVPVINNEAQLYLPYPANPTNGLWASSDLTIIGYTGGQETELLNRTMKGFSPFERGQIVPCAPLALPVETPVVNWDKINWNGENVPTDLLSNYPNASSGRQAIKELKVQTDEHYLYVRLKSSLSKIKETQSNYLATFLRSAEETTSATDYYGWWESAKIDYKGISFDGTFDYSAPVLNMTFNGLEINSNTEISGDDVFWLIAYPKNSHSILSGDKVYIGYILFKGYDATGAIPDKYNPMFEVNL